MSTRKPASLGALKNNQFKYKSEEEKMQMGNQINWKDPSVELPKESGDYIAIILSFKGKANVGTYSYSARHNAFNCYDHDAIPKHKIDVLAWAELPDTPGWVKEDV